MPLLAKIVDDSHADSGSYGSIYAIVQTAVSLAYSLGPFLGGHLAARYTVEAVKCFHLNVTYNWFK
jgi:hypothetical protein